MLHSFFRLFIVWHTLVKYGIDELVPRTPLHFIVTLLTYLMPCAWTRNIDAPIEVRLRQALEKLGPIYVKFGQMLSTRPDLLPADMANELVKLQDDVEPFPTEKGIELIETALKKPIKTAFASFGDEILASASIAQVYTATLHNGDDVVVKVVRPGIRKTITSDLRLMYLFTHFVNFIAKEAKRLRLPEVVKEFEKTLLNELDLMQEASNATMLKHNFADSDILYVPNIYWDYCHKNILVMERIYGVPISDMETLRANNVNLKELAARGVKIFFTQVFYHQYFHADMHPGNIFVDISDPEKPKYVAIDFGIMGSLNDQDQYYLAQNFLAFFNRDYRRVARLHIDSGWIPRDVKVTDFEAAIRKASEPIFGKSLKDISFGQFLLTLFETARSYDMQVQPQLVLLQKTFFNIEGLGRVLYPDLDLWDTGKPILEKWMRDSLGVKGLYEKTKAHTGEYAEILTSLPITLQQVMKKPAEQRRRQHSQLADSILLGFVLLLLCQPTLWGEPFTRYLCAVIAALLTWRLYRKDKK